MKLYCYHIVYHFASIAILRTTQYEDSELKVTVRSGCDNLHDFIVADVLIFDRHNKKEHYHLIIDDHGNEFLSEWRVDH